MAMEWLLAQTTTVDANTVTNVAAVIGTGGVLGWLLRYLFTDVLPKRDQEHANHLQAARADFMRQNTEARDDFLAQLASLTATFDARLAQTQKEAREDRHVIWNEVRSDRSIQTAALNELTKTLRGSDSQIIKGRNPQQ